MPFLRPSFIDNMGWHMAEVYGAVTDRILINLARYFPFWKPGQSVPQSSFEYQANMLAQMGQVTKDTIQIILASLGDADNALTNVLEQAIMEAVKKAQPELFKAVQKGLLNPTKRPVVDPSQMRAFDMYYQQAAQKLNMVNTVMLESTKQAYQATVSDIAARVQVTQNALDIGAAETVTGVSSWNQALRHSIDRMKANGITGFIDHAGHKWSAEAYTAMDIRTTVANTARAAVWETNQDFGNDLYIVSYHDGARPLCYPWQNKVISSTDNARVVQDLDGNEIQVIAQKDTSYGEPAGLFGINCKHYPSPFIPGVSVLYDQNNIMSEKENEKVYEQTQQQRALERQIREQKRDLLMAKAQGADKEELRALRAKIRETDDEIDAFCNETGLPRRQSRESAFTQRSFPPEDTYDVDTFERTQKEAIDKYFNDGGSQQFYQAGDGYKYSSEIPTKNNTDGVKEVVFSPSSSIAEAEEFAKAFVDTSSSSYGVSYDGIDLNVANTVNNHLLQFTKDFKYDKFGGISVISEGSPLGRIIKGRLAAYNRYNKRLLLNQSVFKTVETVSENLKKQQLVVTRYIQNPSTATITNETARNMLEGSVKSGRAHVATNIVDVLNHELGHALMPQLEQLDLFENVVENWGKYADGVSGEATLSLDEYISESFTAWNKGEKMRDKTLVKCFNAVKR